MMRIVVAAAIVAVLLYCVMRIRAWLAVQWFLVQLWRFLTGEAHHGDPVTNAGWFRAGYGPALTPTKHAAWWWYLPRWKRASHRSGGTLGVFALAWGWLTDPLGTLAALAALTFIGLSFLVLLAWRALAGR